MNKFPNQTMYPPYGSNMPNMPGIMPMGMHVPIGTVPQQYPSM